MKRVYDMSTGRVLNTATTAENAHGLELDAAATQLQLQPVAEEFPPKRGIPPELVLADLNAFLDEMS
ncbi:MAG: hypothetical protein P8166_05595 [Candidatus Thiodiazotropha sp.]